MSATKNIYVGVSLTQGYNMTWEEGNRPFSRMMTHGWTEDKEQDQLLHSYASRSGNARCNGYGWSTSSELKDFDGRELPETIFVVIYCSGIYYNENRGCHEYGGGHGSWGVKAAFVDRERAEAFVKTKTEKWLWLWVIPTRRFTPTQS